MIGSIGILSGRGHTRMIVGHIYGPQDHCKFLEQQLDTIKDDS